MNVFKVYDIFVKINNYLSCRDGRNLAYTCSTIKGYGEYTLELNLFGDSHSEDDIKQVGEFSQTLEVRLNLYRETPINNLWDLRNLYKLNLTGNEWVTDVSMLGNIRYLDLSATGVSDVSALGNVYWLSLAECSKVRDVSALGKVHTLDLFRCPVTDVSALGGVHRLILAECYGISDVSNLGNVYDLCLAETGVTDVSALVNVPFLNLNECFSADFSVFPETKDLGWKKCQFITDPDIFDDLLPYLQNAVQ
jgi:hypothetical protein